MFSQGIVPLSTQHVGKLISNFEQQYPTGTEQELVAYIDLQVGDTNWCFPTETIEIIRIGA